VANAALDVLVVDDDPVNLAWLREALAQAGAAVTASGDAPAALALARGQRFDLVLCDLRMPALDGEAFLRELRRGGASAGARVLAMSAELPRADRARLRAAGFHDALPKPIAAATLAALVGATTTAAPRAGSGSDAVLDDAHALDALGSEDAVLALRALLADELPALRHALGAATGAAARRDVLHRLVGGAELCGALRLANAARACSRALAAGDDSPCTTLDAAFDATFAALVSR
jgi:CheY-like chemotaxis protein